METQGSNATISRVRVGTINHVRIAGVIDETFPLTSTSPEMGGLLIVDLGQVERISSFGVRRWIEFASKLPAGGIALYVVNAPPVMVDQLNMVEGFSGVARVLSVLAPYTCRACGEDRLRLVDLQSEAPIIAEGRAPEHSCPVCAGKLEFADLPSEFFDYAQRQQFGTVDPVVMRYLRATTPSAPTALTTHLKIVQDDITYISLASELKADLNVRRLASGLEGRVAFDFSHVNKVEPEAVAKLEQVLATAAQGAKVVLCRVPPPVLNALNRFTKQLTAQIGTLWLPCECRNCGHEHQQRALASEYLAKLRANASPERECPICGGSARLPSIPQLVPLLSRSSLVDKPLDDIEAIEPRALSQYLFGSTNVDPNANKGGGSDISNSISATKLQIIRRLGQGGMAEVFLAKQVGVKGFEKFVVMKKILPQFAENAEFVDMLFAEARANARLTHPNVVQTFDVGMNDGVAYILMEYVRGPDLKKLMNELRRKGLALPLEHALRIVAETAAGLHYAHSYVDPAGVPHPVVHRDVSPHNVLISLDGAIKLSDFGIAKVQGEENTQAGVLKGKISYISPEAASGRALDARNDVFALGVVLFELLTGTLPFKRDHDAATLSAIVREPAPVPSQLKPNIPQDVSDLILRALVKDPARRTPSAAAMREEIEAVMAHHRLNSSPAAVAQFFKGTLGDRLAEFGPVNSGPGGSTGSHPSLSGTGSGSATRVPSGGTGEMVAPAGTGSRPAVGSGTGQFGAVPPPATRPPAPPLATPLEIPLATQGADERTEVYRPAAQGLIAPTALPPEPPTDAVAQAPAPVPARASLSGVPAVPPPPPTVASRPAAMAPPPAVPARASLSGVPAVPPRASGPTPAAVPPRASLSGAPGTGSRPALQPSVPVSARTATQVAPTAAPVGAPARAPAAPAPQAAAAMSAARPPASRSSAGKWAVLGIAGLLVVGASAVVVPKLLSEQGVEVVNREPGEQIYIAGLRVEDAQGLSLEGVSQLVVSTAMNGRLHRFGIPVSQDVIDVRTLPEARPEPGSKGTLRIGGSPGCFVKLGPDMLPGATPVSAPIDAGVELQVVVTCPNQPVWSRWVMAVPGQELEVVPLPKK
ncbi:serine/threonine protein kinase [Archangium gephyra]|uniref:non-specific serine/threonine protein kinase n=1 Tax=Archangium gephyra TaxID=48 RepID=A0AAC8TFP1_9BACT|nr:serine/threonine-protein kinase [Archangium gephyra]AKJ02761.1 serine/threonine protein kinase [Archangium gephyra]REG23305.1 serine/threonine protein kinase [Archangium gephyra]